MDGVGLGRPAGLVLLLLTLLPSRGLVAATEPPVRDITYFLRRLRTVEHVPELEVSHTALASTWDRTAQHQGSGRDAGLGKSRPAHPGGTPGLGHHGVLV